MEQEKPTKPETDRTFPEDDDTLYREMRREQYPQICRRGIPPRQEYCLPALQL